MVRCNVVIPSFVATHSHAKSLGDPAFLGIQWRVLNASQLQVLSKRLRPQSKIRRSVMGSPDGN